MFLIILHSTSWVSFQSIAEFGAKVNKQLRINNQLTLPKLVLHLI